MRLHPLAEQGCGILLDIEDRFAVIGPGEIGFGIGDFVAQQLAVGESLDPDHILAAADQILGIGEQFVVGADFLATDREIALARAHPGLVEQYLFGRVHVALAPGDDRIVAAGLEAAVIPVSLLAIGDAAVVLLYAAGDLGVELVLQRLGRRQQRVGIGIFGRQIGEHLGVLAAVVAQPIIGILPGRAEGRLHLMRLPGRDGWFGNCLRFGSGGQCGYAEARQEPGRSADHIPSLRIAWRRLT